MPNTYTTRNGRTGKRGVFLEGVWHCDCDPRLPADKFQVKNGGKNHGRWFYTCQKPQHKRCPFFLWTDDAKIREEGAVLSNSRSEPIPPALPMTPQKAALTRQLPPTPQTKSNPRPGTPSERALKQENGDEEHDESFDWSSSDDEELLKAEQEVLRHSTPFETPRKAPRTDAYTSPGKRSISQVDTVGDTWSLSDDVFTTPSTSTRSGGTGLLSPIDTPARPQGLSQPAARPGEAEPSTLASDALKILRNSRLSTQVETELVHLLNTHDLRTQGIIKGREITRLAVQTKERKIAELQARIDTLEAEKETTRRVIGHLKQDMASSPKKPRGRGGLPPYRRSEV